MIEKYMNNLTVDKLNVLAQKNNIFLSNEELIFAYNFAKKNWSSVMNNPSSFDITKYKNNFTEENYIKIKNLYLNVLSKYSHYL